MPKLILSIYHFNIFKLFHSYYLFLFVKTKKMLNNLDSKKINEYLYFYDSIIKLIEILRFFLN